MSPVVKRKGERFTLPSKHLLFILTILCTIMMLVTFGTNVFNRPFNRVVGYVIVPFEQGIAKAGEWLANRSDELVQIRTLLAENSALKEQVASAGMRIFLTICSDSISRDRKAPDGAAGRTTAAKVRMWNPASPSALTKQCMAATRPLP